VLRGVLAKTPLPLFLEKISCLPLIPGESGSSGRNPGLDEKSKKREIMGDSRTNDERELSHDLESRSGLKIGDYSV
jgi:hypothetical protein